jgi:NAD(P)-dependent dehydrogenase (short-subunit alcohol dehydrogenase family)
MERDATAIVTGASRGVGRALVCGLAADGFRIAAMARTLDALCTLAEEAKVDSHRILPVRLELEDPASIVQAVRSAVKGLGGRVDLLINNAGMGAAGTLQVPVETFETLLKINLCGPFRILQEVVPLMLQRRSGTIINIASRAGKIGFADCGAYGASKFGLAGLGESLCRELAPKGIKVTTLCPSWINTRMAQEGGTPLSAEEMIQPEDLMKTVRWLLSLSPAACVREVVVECCGAIA